MTKEEAIEVLDDLWKYEHSGFSEKDIREALEMVIRALKNEQTDGDLISRKEAIKQLENLCGECDSSYCGDCRLNCKGTNIKDAFDVLTELQSEFPSITPVIVSDIKFYDDYKAELDIRKKNGDLINRSKAIDLVNYALAENKDVLEELENMPGAEKTANKININEYVKVKLTDYGKDIFYHQYDNINITYGKEIIKPSYPKVDSDGYTSFQLWCFINLYGRYIDMGLQNVIEPLEIVFESAEKTAKWIWKEGRMGIDYCHCSKCGGGQWEMEFPYCPNCGVKMEESEEEE